MLPQITAGACAPKAVTRVPVPGEQHLAPGRIAMQRNPAPLVPHAAREFLCENITAQTSGRE